MSHTTTHVADHLVRSSVWSNELKEVLRDSLLDGVKYVKWINDWPDVGGTLNIPSIGEFTVQEVAENQELTAESLDTGNFQFTVSEYVGTRTYITDEAKENMFYMNELVSQFVPLQRRAIEEKVETDILSIAGNSTDQTLGGQTKDSTNAINGIPHRWVGGGTSETMNLQDFIKANYALTKAHVPGMGRIGIVDPSVAFQLESLTNIVNVSNNPMWEGVVTEGLTTGMTFVKNIYGIDIYMSNYLADCNETIGGLTTANGKANMFFSAESSVLPFIGKWVRQPTVESERVVKLRREEYYTTARYGLKLYRPENLVVVLSDTDTVF